ncbi:MarR family transcriptional regulator [Haloterrigena longa]|uniref:MarR family transcriptional regulator n=1 Tax=Natrinema longum TaxID=370324 RepID=A0A8A2U5I4_9EURY|nr:MarR family transcriptional regulator [Natrinema longum]MBZ6494758.1 MarR family transcriptional regulator [Natrinema longum]QSW83933.1 MarR family transcriptional regulator [Natrinema longum]
MASGTIPYQAPGSPIDDIAYLARSHHRVPALVALTERPRSRSELCELTGVSSSTIRRTLDEFEDRIWIRKDSYQYTATPLGEVIASGMVDLIERVETERKLRDVWHWLPDVVSEYPLETWAAMTVTVADPDAPYRPVNRFESLLEGTDELRFVRPEIALMEPCFDVLWHQVDAGVDVVLVGRPHSHTYFLSTYPERSGEMMQRDNFTVLEHDDLPSHGISVLDERVAISCYERDSGTVQALIDTDAAAVREWAQSVFETYTAEAQPVDPQ